MSEREGLMKYLPWISTPVLFLLLLGVWQFAVSVLGISPFILPTPADVATSLKELVTGPDIWLHLRTTLMEVLVGFVIALVAGTAVGAVLGRVVWLERAVQPALVGLQVVPKGATCRSCRRWRSCRCSSSGSASG